jgi:hypothetical protein
VQPGAPVLGNHVLLPPSAAGAPPHVTIGYPRDPLQQGFTVGAPQHLPGTQVSGTVRFEGQGRDIWAQPRNGIALSARPNGAPAARFPSGWTVQNERIHRPQPPGRGYPFHPGVPVGAYPVYGNGFGFIGSPFFGFPYYGYGLGFGWGLGVDASCGPYWNWGFGCYAPGYGAGYGYGGDNGYFLNAAPYEPSNWPNDDSLQNGANGAPAVGATVFPYDNPTPQELQDNLRADQNETVIFLKDGGVDLVTDYWVADGKLHYVNGGGQNTIPLDDIDIQKTVDVNSSRGLTVTLRPKPGGADNGAPEQPNNAPAPGTAPGDSR